MSSTALTTLQNTALPAHLQVAGNTYLALNDSALGGINAGGFPSISIKGAKFHIIDKSADPPVQTVMAQMADGSAMPAPYLDAVVIAANPSLSKKFYDGTFDPDAEDKTPDCSSENGLAPDSHILKPVHTGCATCPKNVWGSKVTPQGKDTKACSDFKRLVIVPSANLDFKALALDVTPAAIKEYGAYVRTLSGRNVPIIGVVTRITFDPTASFPKLQFDFNRFLTPEEFEVVKERIDSDEVRAIISPKRPAAQPLLPAPTHPASVPAAQPGTPDPTQHNLAASVAAAAAAAIAGTPVTPVDINAAKAAANVVNLHPAAPAMVPTGAGTVTFGVSTPATGTEPAKKRGRPKLDAAQTPPVDVAVAAAAAAVVPSGPDINTVPEPFKAAIIASGGLGSVGGDAVYSAYLATSKATAAVTPPPAANAGVSFVTPPVGSAVANTPGDLNTALANLLKPKAA